MKLKNKLLILLKTIKRFPVKIFQGKGLKVLSPKQMLQRLPIAPAPVKAGIISENLLNEIRQIIYSLYQTKEITKKELLTI